MICPSQKNPFASLTFTPYTRASGQTGYCTFCLSRGPNLSPNWVTSARHEAIMNAGKGLAGRFFAAMPVIAEQSLCGTCPDCVSKMTAKPPGASDPIAEP
jgi:hypothetical protein